MRNAYFNLLSAILFTHLFTCMLFAQSTTVQLATEQDTSSSFRILNSTGTVRMQINSDGGLYLGGTFPTSVIPKEGVGARVIWYPGKYAFRAGYAGTQWNDANTGSSSVAFGSNTTASGGYSIAAGSSTIASGNFSTATGSQSIASGIYSVALGNAPVASGADAVALGASTNASGDYTTALGYYSTASGVYSTVMGFSNTAAGHSSTAMGYLTTAGGTHSTALGNTTTAAGEYTTAIGNYVKANHEGSFMIGDRSKTTQDSSSAIHQMTMRFAGGYRLYTSRECSTGVTLAAGGNSWASVSDSTRKTNYVRADGERFLGSLANLRLGSWNYKGQDQHSFRHYGPMAQEVFHYFGKDEFGTIGNETVIASADMDGIMMICLQALEKRTGELNVAVKKLKAADDKYAAYEAKMQLLEKKIQKLEEAIASAGDDQNITYNK